MFSMSKLKLKVKSWLDLPDLNLQVQLLGGYSPERNSENAAGYDLYTPEDVVLEPKHLTKVPLKFATSFSPGWVGLILDKSSMGAKKVHVFGGVIDADYRGEWAAMLYNNGISPVSVREGNKLTQVVFCRVSHDTPLVVPTLPESVRGSGGFGSTGK